MANRRYFWIGMAVLVGAVIWTAGSWYRMAYLFEHTSLGYTNAHETSDGLLNSLMAKTVFRSLYAIPVALVGIFLVVTSTRSPEKADGQHEQSQFSLRLLMVVTLYAASYLTLFRMNFSLAIAVAGLLPAAATGILCSLDAFQRSRKLKASNLVLAACTWTGGYLVSIGPAMWLGSQTGLSAAVRRALEVAYFPITWLSLNTPLAPWIEHYIMEWKHFDLL